MKPRRWIFATCTALAMMVAGVNADDGEMFRKNVSKTPDLETEHAALRMLPLYVPAQASDGTLLTEGIDYYNADSALVETRDYARPLISFYTDGHVTTIDEAGYGGFPGHGERDAFGAVSLDDGATWNRTNLSKSADQSSFKIRLGGRKKVAYPGDVGRSFMSSDGNKVLAVWVSRFCGGGSPNYAMSDEERALVAEYLPLDAAAACTDGDLIGTPCLYLEDHFSVAGSQGSSDLADEGLPLIGELPYACTWAARGSLQPPTAEGEPSKFVWFKAERLSSGVRDANRPEASCVKGAGCVVTWQEDPDGIRPGEGEGPGEGWSGAIAHHQTDTWYSYIDWDDFDLISDDGSYGTFYNSNDVSNIAEWLEDNATGSPKAAVPMSIPVRLTDNSMCVEEGDKPYCYADFDGSGVADFCASSVDVTIETPEGPTQDVSMCVTEDGRLMRGNTASTRARVRLHGYSTLCDYKADPLNCPIDSAWFSTSYEENKGLGECDDDGTKTDMGKNVWYHTFDMFRPELVSQGLMLNQPAVYPDDFTNPIGNLTADSSLGYNFYDIDPDPIYETQGGLETTLYQAEISRRPSPITQDWYAAGETGTVAFQLWKQGVIRRGGPADIMGRRFVIPTGSVEVCTLKTFTYEWCEITSYEQWEQECYTKEVWKDYPLNPVYKPNRGQCRGDDMPPKCYEYLDFDDNPINDDDGGTSILVDVCDEGVWVPVQFCEVDNEDCRANTSCGPVNSCDDADANCTKTETSSEIVNSCDDADANCTCEPATTYSDFDPTVDNPYDYTYMVCEDAEGNSKWAFTDGSNPRYVKGLCASPAVNISANTILTGECGETTACQDAFPMNLYFDDLEGGEGISKIWTWEQVGPGYNETISDPTLTNLDDTSWENPYDVAKGHRGFLLGDMLMTMYAWSPNWMANTVGHDNYNLYNRRSFDGGQTWSTLPDSYTVGETTYIGDGTTTCEWMGPAGSDTEYPVCTGYAAGEFEQTRNVSQLVGTKVTILDPRYSPATPSITEASVGTASLPAGFIAPLYEDDERNPSRYFMVYETGDNTTVEEGEAEPLDLFYSRAVDFGDDYLVWAEDDSTCLPSTNTEDLYDLSGFCNEFDALEGKQDFESGEAAITTSPGGQFFYALWNQVDFDRAGEEIGSDAWFRRVLFLDDYIPGDDSEPVTP